MEMDQPTAAQAAAATAASIQALAEALQASHAPAAPPHRLVLSSFWKEDPVGWFHYAEAEFVISGYPADSYLCYSHVLRALPPDVIAAVRDLVRVVTPENPGVYSCLKQSLLSRYTPTDIANCFRFIDHPPLGDRHVLTLFSNMQALQYYQQMPTSSSTPTSSAACRSPCRMPWSAKASFPLESLLKPPPCCPTQRWQPPFRSTRPCRCRRRLLRS